VLLSREVSIRSRKFLKLSSLHRFGSTGLLTPGRTGSREILARGLVKDRAHPCSATPEGSPV
jgi:hypothetical protein